MKEVKKQYYKIVYFISLFLLVSCSGEAPPIKKEYIGHWKNDSMSFLITKEGSIKYEKKPTVGKSQLLSNIRYL